MSHKIYMRPTSGVYANFKNLRYEPWTAIAEFVDNSTQSFFDHREKLKKLNNFKKLVVEVTYEQKTDGNDVLTIKDNAYGMEIIDFERAIRIDKPPLKTDGRNEFGMGLKTAACWFGTYWTVISTQLGSKYKYSASVNVKQIAETQEDYVDYEVDEAKLDEHFTILKITNLNKKITGSRTIWKVKSLLASIYREDIRSGEISVIYNGTELSFEEVEIFKETQPDGAIKEWKLDVDFTIEHEKEMFPVKGFIAIRQRGSVQDAGFALLRRSRVIIGGIEQNYRPKELFGDGNSYTFQRVFGELHMDNWKVTQAKDNFDWHNGGLEEKFIEKLRELMKDLRNKAEKIRVRQTANSRDIVNQAAKELQIAGIFENPQITFSDEQILVETKINDQELSAVDEEVADTSVVLTGSKYSKISIDRNDIHYNLLFSFDDFSTQWLSLKQNNSIYHITLNMKHPFFSPLTSDSKFIVVMTKFVLSMVIAEIESIKMSFDGETIGASDIRMKMNSLLEESLKIKVDE